MRLIIFSKDKTLYGSRRLLQEGDNLGFSATHINPHDLIIPHDVILDHKKGHQTLFFHRISGVDFDDFDLMYSKELQISSETTMINPPEVLVRLRDKGWQSLFFREHSIPHIPTLSLRGKITMPRVAKIAEILDPYLTDGQFIVKSCRGNRGIGVNLIPGEHALLALLETFWALSDQKFLIQPYLTPTIDYRVLLTQNKILGIIRREEQTGDFRKNSSRDGAKLEFLPDNRCPCAVLDLAQKVLSTSGTLLAGIDLLQWRGELFVGEINLVPGFALMEELSHINIAREILLEYSIP